MSELAIQILRFGLLALMWLYIAAALGVMRTDIFGHRTKSAAAAPVPRQASSPKPKHKPKQASPRRGQPRKLVVTEGALAGTALTLGAQPIMLGRSDSSTLVLTDDYASTHHARIVPTDQGWILEDLGSTNGTYLDRTKITEPTLVPAGVPIRIGKTVLELRK